MRLLTLISGLCLVLLHGVTLAQPSRSSFINGLLIASETKAAFAKTGSRTSSTVSRHTNSAEYSWPNAASGWVHFANSTYLYTSDGRLMQRTCTAAGNSQPTEQISYTYTGANLAEKVRKVWDTNAWQNDTREMHTYDLQGNLTEVKYESWYNGAWTTDDGIRYIRSANAAGQLTALTTQTWIGTWENATRETYTLSPAGTWTEVLLEIWDQSTWQPSEKITNITWHNWSRRELQSYLMRTFSQGIWVNAENAAFTYSPTQQILQLDQAKPNGWEPKYRYTQFYDQQGNFLGYRDDELQAGIWVRNNEVRHQLQYDASLNVTEQVNQVLDYNNQTLVNTSKSVFSNFQIFTIAGTRPEIAATNLTVYPNPAAEAFTVAVKNSLFQPATVTLTDLSGRKVLHQAFGKNATLSEEKISVAHLPAGVYLLELTSANGEQLKQRLVKN